MLIYFDQDSLLHQCQSPSYKAHSQNVLAHPKQLRNELGKVDMGKFYQNMPRIRHYFVLTRFETSCYNVQNMEKLPLISFQIHS